jgi:hypothetical protein
LNLFERSIERDRGHIYRRIHASFLLFLAILWKQMLV